MESPFPRLLPGKGILFIFSCFFCKTVLSYPHTAKTGNGGGPFAQRTAGSVRGSGRPKRSIPERAMRNRRGAPLTAQASGAITIAQAGWQRGNLPSQRHGTGRFFYIRQSFRRLLKNMGSSGGENRVQSTDDFDTAKASATWLRQNISALCTLHSVLFSGPKPFLL